MSEFKATPAPRTSPWGRVQHATHLAPGAWYVSTAGHGGIVLSDERLKAMPAHLRSNTFAGGRYFEEDCDWCLPALAWEDVRSALGVSYEKAMECAMRWSAWRFEEVRS